MQTVDFALDHPLHTTSYHIPSFFFSLKEYYTHCIRIGYALWNAASPPSLNYYEIELYSSTLSLCQQWINVRNATETAVYFDVSLFLLL